MENMKQYGAVTYPKTGDARQFVLAMASNEKNCVIVWCDGYAKLCRAI